jgi:hemoglobin/transferrin/lactoferrin receptor protein
MANTMHFTPRRWIQDFVGRRLACTGMVLALIGIACALQAAEAMSHFDIKAQPLAEALMVFGAQAGASVVAPTELTVGKTSKPVSGELTKNDALSQMLQGTGLGFEATANGTIVIVRMPVRAVRAL